MTVSCKKLSGTMTLLLRAMSFFAATTQLLPAFAAEVRFIAVSKGQLWEQTDSSSPKELAGAPFQFRAFVELARPNAISTTSLKWPAPPGTTRTLANRTNLWELQERFATRVQLNNSHPNGVYTFLTESAADGRRTNSVSLSTDSYPLALRIANFAEAQAIDSRADFTLRWDAAGTGANGFVHLRILKDGLTVFQSPSYPQAAGALNGNAASFVIPRNTLAEGGVYQGEITIWRKVIEDTKGYPGVAAWAGYTQTTSFPLRAVFAITDVHWYGFAKVQRCVQTSANPPAAVNVFEMLAFADATQPDNLDSASIGTSSGPAPLVKSGSSWRLRESFPTQGALDTRFPPGALTLTLDTAHNGIRQQSLALPAGSFPAAPQIANFNEASAIDSTQPFVLRWNPLAGGAASDFVQVQVRKGAALALSSAEHPFAPGALNGTSTSFALPAGFLGPGEACEVSILFLKAAVRDTFSYPRALGLCGYARQTTATVRARGGNVTTPLLRNLRRNGGAIQFDFAADPGRQYVVQGSADFRAWSNLLFTNAPGASFTLQLPIDAGSKHQFLRIVTQ